MYVMRGNALLRFGSLVGLIPRPRHPLIGPPRPLTLRLPGSGVADDLPAKLGHKGSELAQNRVLWRNADVGSMSLWPPTTPMSQASTRFGVDSSLSLDNVKGLQRQIVDRVKRTSFSRDIFLFLVAFRILNALSVKTFFQPDEFFQSLEPAWDIAFGGSGGAWITWVRGMLPLSVTTADV